MRDADASRPLLTLKLHYQSAGDGVDESIVRLELVPCLNGSLTVAAFLMGVKFPELLKALRAVLRCRFDTLVPLGDFRGYIIIYIIILDAIFGIL